MTDTTTKTSAAAVKSSEGFSPISKLVKDSWERVKRTWKQLVLLYLVLFAAMALIFGMVGAFFVTSYLASMSTPEALGGLITTGLVAVVLLSIVVIAISSVFGTSILLAVSESKEHPTIGAKMSRGFQLFVPMLVAGLLMVFFVYGGLGLFIIPGIAIAILTSFTVYEIVFTQNRALAAVKNSVTIVQQNFGALFTRVGLIILISIGISILLSILDSSMGGGTTGSGLSGLVSLVIQPVFALFSLAYYYQVYVEARNATDFSKSSSIGWMWIVSTLGWAVGIFLLISMSRFFGTMLEQGFNGRLNSDYDYLENPAIEESTSTGEFDTESFLDLYGKDMTEEEKEAFKQSIEKADELMQSDQNAVQDENSL